MSSETSAERRLYKAIDQVNIEEIKALLKEGVDVNCSGRHAHDDTPLHCAVQLTHERQYEVVELLVENGADVNARSKFYGEHTPLSYAIGCRGGNCITEDVRLDIMRLLLKHGANVELICDNCTKYAPIHKAANIGKIEIIQILLDAKVDVNTTDIYGRAPLHYVRNNPVTAEFLIKAGANINIRDMEGNAPLHVAAELFCPAVVKVLLEHGAAVNEVNNSGDTPLHGVFNEFFDDVFDEKDKFEVLQLLLKHKADLNAENSDGKTPCQKVDDYAVTLYYMNERMKYILDRIHYYFVMFDDDELPNDDGTVESMYPGSLHEMWTVRSRTQDAS